MPPSSEACKIISDHFGARVTNILLKTSESLSWSDRLRQTVPYCWTGNREGSVSELGSCPWNKCSPGCWQNEDIDVLGWPSGLTVCWW